MTYTPKKKDFHIFSKEKSAELKTALLKELKTKGFKILFTDTGKRVGWTRYKIEVAKSKGLWTDISPYSTEILAIENIFQMQNFFTTWDGLLGLRVE